MTTKPIITRTILGLAISASVAFTAVSAAENETILHQAIHDYSDEANVRFKENASPSSGVGYDIKIVLDEAYHDYDSRAVARFNTPQESYERAEFAAFEAESFNVPWVLNVTD